MQYQTRAVLRQASTCTSMYLGLSASDSGGGLKSTNSKNIRRLRRRKRLEVETPDKHSCKTLRSIPAPRDPLNALNTAYTSSREAERNGRPHKGA